jgi:hypothetical protein
VKQAVISALAPVLSDVLRADLGVSLIPGEPVIEHRSVSRTIVWAQDGSGTGVQVYVDDSRASTVQDIVVEDFLLTPWPKCPRHPGSGHPLLATVRGDEAVWTCPHDNAVISLVGTLPAT